MDNRRAVVIGGNHHNTLGVIRSLGEKGIKSELIVLTNERFPYICHSKYLNSCEIVESEPQIIDILKQLKFGDHPVVIACSDSISSILDLHYDELSPYYCLPGSETPGRITQLMDKEIMGQLAVQNGLTTPQSVSIDTVNDCKIGISFPWIIKPLVSKNGSKADIKRLYNLEEWQAYRNKHKTKVQIQKLIDRDFEFQLIGVSLRKGEEIIIPGVSVILRPAETTNTAFLHYERLDSSYDNIVKRTMEFVKATTYSGLFSAEFIRGKDGRNYFMEINFRNDGNAICVTAAGYNLPYIWYLYNINDNYHSEICMSKISPVYIMPELDDFYQVLKRRLNFFRWLSDLRRTDRFMEYDKRDKAPFYYLLKNSIIWLTKKFLKLI